MRKIAKIKSRKPRGQGMWFFYCPLGFPCAVSYVALFLCRRSETTVKTSAHEVF